ncbi:MAG: nucleotide exchange factor GrpE [Bacteroidia bacterium]
MEKVPSAVENLSEAEPDEATESASAIDWQAEAQKLREQLHRWVADYDNFRKRMQREKERDIQLVRADMIRMLLPLLDNIQRGLIAAQAAADIQKLKEGLQMIEKQFLHLLQKWGIEELPALGHTVNPDFHEVIATEPAQKEEEKSKIVKVVEAGYKWGDAILRPAKVIVAE